MNGIWVNIFDLLHAHKVGGTAPKFRNVKALANYSYATDQIFPKPIYSHGGCFEVSSEGGCWETWSAGWGELREHVQYDVDLVQEVA